MDHENIDITALQALWQCENIPSREYQVDHGRRRYHHVWACAEHAMDVVQELEKGKEAYVKLQQKYEAQAEARKGQREETSHNSILYEMKPRIQHLEQEVSNLYDLYIGQLDVNARQLEENLRLWENNEELTHGQTLLTLLTKLEEKVETLETVQKENDKLCKAFEYKPDDSDSDTDEEDAEVMRSQGIVTDSGVLKMLKLSSLEQQLKTLKSENITLLTSMAKLEERVETLETNMAKLHSDMKKIRDPSWSF